MGIITADGGGCAFLPEERKSGCIQCGHCEAVCPANAIKIVDDGMKDAAHTGLQPHLSPDDIKAYFLNRRSVRTYEQEPVDLETLEQLFNIVRYAPTGVNRQELQWIVIRDAAVLRKCKELTVGWMRQTRQENPPLASAMGFTQLVESWDKGTDRIGRNAPVIAVAYGHRDDRVAPMDGTIALAHLELLAPAFGLGACWAGYLFMAACQSAAVREEMGIPESHACLGVMMLGYPRYRYQRVPKRKPAAVVWR
jgi:nitroreductase